MLTTTQTIWSIYLDIFNKLNDNGTPTIHTASTINNALGTPDAVILTKPILNMFTLGLGGNTDPSITNAGLDIWHATQDVNVFKPIPFRFVRADNDLTASERENYGLRRAFTHNNVNYIGYYGKMFEDSPKIIKFLQVDHETKKLIDFNPETDIVANPNPALSTPYDLVTSGNYIMPVSHVEISLTKNEVSYIKEAASILYAESNPVIKEIALASSTRQNITVNGITYTECCRSQVNFFVTSLHNINDMEDRGIGMRRSFDIGGSELKLVR